MTPYRNNLTTGDIVMHADTRRVGRVTTQPRESSRMTAVQWQGTASSQYVDVLKLRLVVDGKPEDVPPCDGEPPQTERAASASGAASAPEALAAVKKQREAIAAEMSGLETRFKTLRTKREQLDRAIAILSEPSAQG